MAISPKDEYPSQIIDSDADYPLGKARDVVVPGDGSGTPLQEKWLNDLWGFMQELLSEADASPSGAADKVGASQYADAIRSQLRHFAAQYTLGGTPAQEEKFTLAADTEYAINPDPLFTLADGDTTVTPPDVTGLYAVALTGSLLALASAANPLQARLEIRGSGPARVVNGTRWSADELVGFHVAGYWLLPAAYGAISVWNAVGGTSAVLTPSNLKLSIVRIARVNSGSRVW